MQCNNPITLNFRKNPLVYARFPHGLVVPCGKCIACKISKAREWSLRILHEMDSWDKRVFLTLTYNDENIPENYTVKKTEFQKFIKRLRKNYGKKIKYYGCGEYGEQTDRPHYHLILFGIGIEDLKIDRNNNVISGVLVDSWRLGNINAGSVTYDSARYVAQYIDKKYDKQKAEEVYLKNGREIPFQLCSLGMGLDFVKKNSEQLEEQLYTTVKGVKCTLPRYYKNKLNIDVSRLKNIALEKKLDLEIKLMNKGIMTSFGRHIHEVNANKQREATLNAKIRMNKARKKKL